MSIDRGADCAVLDRQLDRLLADGQRRRGRAQLLGRFVVDGEGGGSRCHRASPMGSKRSCTAISILQRIKRNKSNLRSGYGWSLLRIFVTESLAVFVVGEQLAVAAEIDDRPQGPLGVVLAHVILEFLTEAGGGRAMGRAFVEDPLDV